MPNRRAMAGFLTDLLGRPPEQLAGVELWRDAAVARPAPLSASRR
ncbi:MAG TPA: hypothetical protein VF468_06550 [Actinomycetota bacterium]|nr:hypothetical protein [Actinomycetota bacterium]